MPGGAIHYDDIVVGGGTTGAVIAARLSQDEDRRVLLLEAGPDYPNSLPYELHDASFSVTSGHNWDLQAVVGQGRHVATAQQGRIGKVFDLASGFLTPEEKLQPASLVDHMTTFPYPLGKLVGGGSAVNGCLALHARPEDYADWNAAASEEWSWDRVRPYISRMAAADTHKPTLAVEIKASEDLTLCQRAFLDACHSLGNRDVDLTQGQLSGVGTIPRSVHKGRRVSTAALYLAAARHRQNLTIQSHCLVDRLLFEGGRGALIATGVEALIENVRCRFSAGHTTVSAGAVHSPAILLRSGVGAVEEMERCRVKAVLDLPGVGKNLQDHASVSLWGVPKPRSCFAGEPVHQVMLQQRSAPSVPFCDLQLYMLSGLPTEQVPFLRQMVGHDLAAGISAVLARPRSRGRVEIVDADPTTAPRIYLNCLDDRADLFGMMEAVRSGWRLLRTQNLDRHIDRLLLWTQNIMDSDQLLENSIRATVRTTWHPAGTLRMGKQEDRMAVVDAHGGLFGCQNVTVGDASIMPTIPSVPPNLTCMLIGERIAAHRLGWQSPVE
jgi:choline dehydrogenase